MLGALKGWRTYLSFAALFILAVGRELGWATLSEDVVAPLVDFITHPMFLTLWGILMRKVTSTSPAV